MNKPTQDTARERVIAELSNKCAEAYDIDTTEDDTGFAPEEGSITWTVSQAVAAGYTEGLEDAARKIDELAQECTAINDFHGHECEIDCDAVKEVAAAIRKLKDG